MRPLLLLLIWLISGCAATAQPGPGGFSFGVFGDMPYFEHEKVWTANLMREMDSHELAFVTHVGDIKSGSSRCDDAVYHWTRELFDGSAHPLIYVPGDNEWTDCHRRTNGGFDPEERLRFLRTVFYTDEHSLGQRRLRLDRQSSDPRHAEYRENVRWQHGSIMFVALNIPGSNNNRGRSGKANSEYLRRDAANLAWLSQSFELASRRLMRGMVIVIHANPRFEQRAARDSGYFEFRQRLAVEVEAFGKPVLLVHGDTHQYRVDQPLTHARSGERMRNFTRLETFGSPLLGWVKVSVDPSRPELFSFETFRYRAAER